MPPHKTERGITTNIKAKNNYQKIDLYRSLTTEELKKHSCSLVGGVKTGRQGGKTCNKAAAGGPDIPTFACT